MVCLISVTVVFSSVRACVRAYTYVCIYVCVSTLVDTLLLCTCMQVDTIGNN